MKNTQGSELYEQFVSILKNWGYDPGEHNKFEINEMVAVVTSSNQALLQKVREMVKQEIARQNGLRAGCPYCGYDLCDCESGQKTALRILSNLAELESGLGREIKPGEIVEQHSPY